MDYTKVMIATPVRDGRFHTGYVVGMLSSNGLHNCWTPYSGQTDIYVARNTLMNLFWQRPQYETCVFIDSDIGFSREDLQQLIESKGDVVSGIYTDKCQPPAPFCRDEFGELIPQQDIPPEGMIRSMLIPGGFFKITRSTVQKIIDKKLVQTFGTEDDVRYAFYVTRFHKGLMVSEDYSLALLLNEAGVQPWTNCGIRLNHDGRTWDGKPTDQLSNRP